MSAHTDPERPAASIAVKLIAAVAVMLVLVAGIIFWGRLAGDDRTAMLLTGAWFAIVLVGGVLLTRKRTGLRLPLALGFAIVAAAATVVLGLPMLGDDVVDERVVTAAPAPAASAGAAAPSVRARNMQIPSGAFRSIAHPGDGTAAVVELTNGKRVLTLRDFETDNGPDLRVYLSTGDPAGGGDLGESEDLGALKGNKGNQQYEIPAGVDVARFSTVVIWCRAFSVAFTSAPLAKT